jgi:predicted transcriptional regulator
MATRSQFMPSQSAQIEDQLAREMANLKIEDERKKKEVERICSQSNELKELQNKIMQAYQNKERAAQITEKQYRTQV